MTEVKGLYRKISRVRKDFHEKERKPSGLNSHSKYTYFEKGDFIPDAMELLDKYGLCVLINVEKDVAVMRIIDVDDNLETTISSPCAESCIKGASPIQQMGSTITYMTRYLWIILLEICEVDTVNSTIPMPSQSVSSQASQGKPQEEAPVFTDEQNKILEDFYIDCEGFAGFPATTSTEVNALRDRINAQKGTPLFALMAKNMRDVFIEHGWSYDDQLPQKWYRKQTSEASKTKSLVSNSGNPFGNL